MEDLKIRVENEAESKEAQGLFFELGATWLYKNSGKKSFYTKGDIFLFCIDGVLGTGDIDDKDFFNKHPATKITLPELRDKVVLERNSVDDATHTCNGHKYYLTASEFFEYINGYWENVDEYVDGCIFEPIEKQMKEYLDPENEYALITADDEIKGDSNWIEVPEGADCLLKFDDGLEFYRNNKTEYFSSDFEDWKGVGIHKVCIAVKAVWQRKEKEYINKATGEYRKTLDKVSGSNWLEIPVGAMSAVKNNLNKLIHFINIDGDFMSSEDIELGKGYWYEPSANYTAYDEVYSFWQRPQQPEELPFVDDTFVNPHNHYFIDVSDLDKLDVYELLYRFEVNDPCLQHIVKKALCAGKRGHKDFKKDLQDISDTARRALAINGF